MLSQISWSSPINEDKYNFQLPFNFTGNTECCMLLLGNLENPLPTDLLTELLNLVVQLCPSFPIYFVGKVFSI